MASLISSRAPRVVIVDDHLMCAEALQVALRHAGYSVGVVPVSSLRPSAEPLVAALRRIQPQVVLLDLDLGAYGDGLPLVGPAAQAGADVIVLAGPAEPGRWCAALNAGASNVIPKNRPLRDVLTALRRLMSGLPATSRAERKRLLELWGEQRAEQEGLWARFRHLSAREAEILGLLMQGHSVGKIAAMDDVSEGTVRTQVKNVLAKLKVSSQLSAVALAHDIGWQPPIRASVRS